jgi:hypothetical protein
MSFYEYWVESSSGRRGPTGTIKVGEQHEACRCKPLVVARFIFVVIGLPAIWFFTVPLVPLPLWQAAAAVIGGTLIYVAVSYLLDPQPDMDNMGVAGGLIDNPFRYSDDINRHLATLAIVLGPGRFVAESVMDIGVLFEQPSEPEEFAPPAEFADQDASEGFGANEPGTAEEQLQQYLSASPATPAKEPQPTGQTMTEEEELAASGLSSARFMLAAAEQQQQGQQQGWSRFGR